MQEVLTIAVFIIAYFFIALEKINRVAIVIAGASTMVLIGATDAHALFYSHETGIDWNVIFLLLGMMIIVSVIHKTGIFDWLGFSVIRLLKGHVRPIFMLILLIIAVASSLLDNVTTILLAVPMSFAIARKLHVSARPFIIGGVLVSNIGGAATLIGDPPNIIIASKADLSFNDFLVHMAPISIVVLVVVIPLLAFLFRKELSTSGVSIPDKAELSSTITDMPLLVKSLVVLTITVTGFIAHPVTHIEPSITALLGAGALVLFGNLKPREYALDIEWETLIFFAGLFAMVGALVHVGAMEDLAQQLSHLLGDNPAKAANVILIFSAVLSGIVDNIPYVASMSPVLIDLGNTAPALADQSLWWALALGADYGGNLTIVGASANVVAIGLARAQGLHISFKTFFKYGAITTLVSIAISFAYVNFRYF